MYLYLEKQMNRKDYPIYTGVLKYFPKALMEVSKVSKIGNDQHNPDQEIHWDRSKSMDHSDALTRHLLEAESIDEDGVMHLAKVCWRALAWLEVTLEKQQTNKHHEK